MPLTIPDQTIAAQVKVPDAMNTLSNVMNVANGAQTLKSHQIANESNAAILQERNNIRQLFQSPQEFMGDDGNPDYNKLMPKIMEAAPTQGAQFLNQIFQGQKESQAAKQSLLQLNDSQRGSVGQFLMSQANEPGLNADALNQKLDGLVKLNPNLSPAVSFFQKYILAANADNPAALKQHLLQAGQMVMSPAQQVTAITPNGPVLNNGQQQTMLNVNPMAGNTGPVSGVSVQNQLPPSTPILGANNTPGYLGPQNDQAGPQGLDLSKLSDVEKQFLAKKNPEAFARGAQDFQQTSQQQSKPGFVASGVPVGAGTGIEGTQNVINKHWGEINEAAKSAPQDIGVLQNIISHAHGAATGVLSDRQAFLQAISGKLGMTQDQLATTDTNLLLKNSAMLQLAGGDTNLAKTIAGAANPNNHMDESAIKQAAYQVIGQKQMSVAAQKLFGPLKDLADHGSPEAYNAIKSKFDAAADPRILQLQYMAPDEKIKMKQSMTPAEQKQFGDKIKVLQSLGVVQ